MSVLAAIEMEFQRMHPTWSWCAPRRAVLEVSPEVFSELLARPANDGTFQDARHRVEVRVVLGMTGWRFV